MLCCQRPLSRGEAACGFPHSVILHVATLAGARVQLPLRATGRCLYPNPIRSDTSCHGIAAPPVGDSDVARPCSPEGAAPSTIPPREPHPPRRVGARGPEAAACASRLRVDARHGSRIQAGCEPARNPGQGPHHPRFREEERDPPHPRCLPSARPATGTRTRPSRERIRATGGRGEPYLYPGMVFSTACCQPVDKTRRLFQSRCIRRP